MRFHLLDTGGNFNPECLKQKAKKINDFGYYSLLLTYHSNNADNLIKSILAADNNIDLKFMIAIRTYAVSPEYLAMICRSYNEYFPNKIILNVCSGDIHKDENSIENIVMFGDNISTPKDRLLYTKEWMEKFIKISSKWYVPEIFMAGHSKETIEMSNIFNATNISMLNMYNAEIKKENPAVANKQLITMGIVVRDTEEQALEFLEKNHTSREKQWTLYGTNSSIKQKLRNMSKDGITDIMIVIDDKDDQAINVHNMIRELVG